jgi:excisionase family DNA binding protein
VAVQEASEKLLTLDEAARYFGVSRETVARWQKLKLLRVIELPSGRLRIRQSELARVLRPAS